MTTLAITSLVTGIVLLIFGRRLFWLFVGVAGFMIGMDIAERFFSGSDTTKLLIALVIGIIGALLAVLFYRVAVAVAGFAVGGHLTMRLIDHLLVHPGQSTAWILCVIGGIIGAVLVLLFLDWALIVLSSFAGASLVVHAIMLKQSNLALIFILLALLGILIQSGILRRSRIV
jgi:hypothetical protein